jgi:hypothetical protein
MLKKANLSRIAMAVAVSIGLSAPVLAQETTSSIRGNIVGPQGNPAAGTEVTVTHLPSGTTRQVVVGANGQFNLSGLRVGGPYQIIVDSAVFEDVFVDDIFLSLGEPSDLNFELKDEQAVEKIVVTASQVSSVAFGQKGPSATFDIDVLESAPAINRNITDIIRQDPRVYVNEMRGSANPVQCVGKSNRANSLTLDGVKMNDSFGLKSSGYPTISMPFSFDAIEQVSVEIAPFDVVFSGFTGCNINAVTKSGGNTIFGNVFYEYGSSDLQGDSLEGDKLVVPDNDDKKYGFTLGLPLVKDTLFGFVSYEKVENTTLFSRGTIGSGAIEEVDLRQSDLDRIIQISNDLYQYDPGPVPTSAPAEDEKLLVKLDWNINDNHRASYTYNYFDGFFLNESDGDSNEFELEKHLYTVGDELKSHTLAFYSDWTDNFSTELRFTSIDLANRQVSVENVAGVPGGQNFGEMRIEVLNPDNPDARPVDVYIGGDDSRSANDLSYSVEGLIFRGNYFMDNGHKITFGFEREELDVFNLFVQHVETEIRFDGIDNFEAGLADAIYYNNAPSHNPIDAAADWAYEFNSLYVQDEFELVPDLDVVLGVRYDWYTTDDAPPENAEFLADYGFSNAQTLDGEGLLQPRIAFNYRLNDDTELRGGIGLFSGGNPNVWLSNNYSNNNVAQFGQRGRSFCYTPSFRRAVIECNDTQRSLFDDDVVYRDVEEGAPNGPGYGIPSELYDAVTAGSGDNFDINYLDPNFKIPSELKLALGVTHLTENDFVLQADLLLSQTRDQAIVLRGDLEQTGVNDAGYPVYSSERMSSLVLTNSDETPLSYTLSFGAQKSWDNGIEMTAGYAYNRARDVQPMTSSVAFSNYQFRAFFDPQEDVASLSDYNIEHRATASVSYSHEFLSGYDTTFTAFALIQSGRPYSFTVPRGDVNDIYNFNPFLDSNNVLPVGGERNSEESDWWNKVDLKVNQELPAFVDGHRLNAYLVFDNFTNFLNDDWGVAYETSRSTVDVGTQSPQRRVADASTWEVRIGVNYTF